MVKLLALLALLALSISLAWPQIFLVNRRKRDGTAIPNNCDSVNDANLKAYWRLDEASGSAAVDDKGANDLADNNTVGTTSGTIGTSRDFSSAFNRYFSLADNTDLSMGDIDFSVGAWVRFGAALNLGEYPSIVTKWSSVATKEYALYLNGDSQRYEFSVSNDGVSTNTVVANTFGDPSDGVWHYVIAWHDAGANTINIQIDNATADSVAHTTGVFDSTSPFQIGANDGGFFWTGQIDEAFVTKRVLTSGERASLYNVGLGCRPSGL